jgi:hypothetical protein
VKPLVLQLRKVSPAAPPFNVQLFDISLVKHVANGTIEPAAYSVNVAEAILLATVNVWPRRMEPRGPRKEA